MNTKDSGPAGPVLIIRFSSLGDVVLTEPATRALRARYPRAEIHYLTKSHYEDIVGGFEAVDRVIAYRADTGLSGLVRTALRLRGARYRLAVDLHGNLRSRIVRSLVRAAEVGVIKKKSFGRFLLVRCGLGRGMQWPTAGDRYRACIPGGADGGESLAAGVPSLRVAESARKAVERLLGGKSAGSFPPVTGPLGGVAALQSESGADAGADARPFIAIAPGARWDTKMWPWERFAEVGLSLARRTGMKILVLGSGADRDLCARVVRNMGEAGKNLAGETSLMEAAALLEKSSLLVTNDTGLMHLAVAVGTPTVAIFGPTSRELGFMPPGTLARIVETDLPCRPCTTIGRRSCPLGSHDCMLQVTTALVLRESLTQLERRKVAKA